MHQFAGQTRQQAARHACNTVDATQHWNNCIIWSLTRFISHTHVCISFVYFVNLYSSAHSKSIIILRFCQLFIVLPRISCFEAPISVSESLLLWLTLWPYLVNTASVAAFKRAIKARTHTQSRERERERCGAKGGVWSTEMEMLGSEMLNARAHITTTRGHWLLHLHSRQELKALSRVFRGRSGERSVERRLEKWRKDCSPKSRRQPGIKEMRDLRASSKVNNSQQPILANKHYRLYENRFQTCTTFFLWAYWILISYPKKVRL